MTRMLRNSLLANLRGGAARAAHLGPRSGGVLFAASVAAVAWRELESRRVTRADLAGDDVRVERLIDLRNDRENLDRLERALRTEWGEFGLLGFASIDELTAEAGRNVFVARVLEDGRWLAKGACQTTLVNVHGDPNLLRRAFGSFQDLTSRDAFHRARARGGDTAVLLQIAVFAEGERGIGLGSLLRSTVLHMLDADVRYALTTTPVDTDNGAAGLKLGDPKSFTPSMRFHARGGAVPTLVLPGFKTPHGAGPSRHGTDIVVMRYARDERGEWPVKRPEMRLRSMGPLEESLLRAVRRVRSLGGQGQPEPIVAPAHTA